MRGGPGMGGGPMGGGGTGSTDPEVNQFIDAGASKDKYDIVPVALSFYVEQAHIPDVLIAFENSPMAIQVVDVDWQRPDARVHKPVKGEDSQGLFDGYGGRLGGRGNAIMAWAAAAAAWVMANAQHDSANESGKGYGRRRLGPRPGYDGRHDGRSRGAPMGLRRGFQAGSARLEQSRPGKKFEKGVRDYAAMRPRRPKRRRRDKEKEKEKEQGRQRSSKEGRAHSRRDHRRPLLQHRRGSYLRPGAVLQATAGRTQAGALRG